MTDTADAPQCFQLAGPADDRANAATWNLCARVYLDPEFRDYVLNDRYERSDKALAPDPGIDRGLVVRHALHARGINAVTMIAIFAIGTVIMVTQPNGDRLVLAACCLWWLAAATLLQQLFAEAALPTETYAVGQALNGPRRIFAIFLLGLILFGIGAFMGWSGRLTFLLGPLAGLALVSAGCGAYRVFRIARIPNGKHPPNIRNSLLDRIEATCRPEVVTHRADKLAFVGFGDPGQSRQILLSLEDTTCGRPAALPDLELLVKEFRVGIESIASESGESPHWDPAQLELFEHVFVADSKVRGPVYWVKDLHIGTKKFESIAEIRSAPTPLVRPYLRIQVCRESGELVTNLFVRFVMQPGLLTIDFVPYHLLPTETRYQLFKCGQAPSAQLLVSACAYGFVAVPLIVVQAPFSAMKTLLRWSARWTRPRMPWLFQGRDKFGAVTGIRQQGCGQPESHPNEQGEADTMAVVLIRRCMEVLKAHLQDKIDVTPLEDELNKPLQVNFNGGRPTVGVLGGGGTVIAGAIGPQSRGVVGRFSDWSRERIPDWMWPGKNR